MRPNQGQRSRSRAPRVRSPLPRQCSNVNTHGMNNTSESDGDTPWEFYPDDDLREEPGNAAEDEAMHIITPDALNIPMVPEDEDDDPVVVHYLDDEDPEIPDVSTPPVSDEITPGVEDLLVRQHYMTNPGDD